MEVLNTQLLRIFDWLLWTTIQGSVLIVVIVLLQLILRRRMPVRWHYLLWVLLLIRLAVPWLPESKMSIFNLVPRSIQQGQIIESYSESRSAHGMDLYYFAETTDTQETEAKGDSEAVSVSFVRLLPLLWLLGTVVIAGYVCVRNINLWWTIKRERPITDQTILDLLEDCKMQMGIQTILGVVVSDRIKSPALFGFIRPRLLLPQGILETYGHEELRYVFIHELAHLKQRDIYLGWLIALLHVAHWFNPLMWFAFGRMRADREMACDRLAISTMGPDEPPKYGRTIVNLLESFSQVRYLPSVAGILEDTCQMERRIKMITDYRKTSRTRWTGAMLLVAVLVCVVLTNAYVAKADFTFGMLTKLGREINSPAADGDTSISSDGLELFFEGRRPDGYGRGDIFVSTRETTNDPWGEAEILGPPINGTDWETSPDISADGLTLYFTSTRSGFWDISVTTRATRNDPWEEPMNLGPTVNSTAQEFGPSISSDGLSLYFNSDRSGGFGALDLWVTTRTTTDAPWEEPVNLGPTVNSSQDEAMPDISADGLKLFFCDFMGAPQRPGGCGGQDIWVATRASTNDPWEEPVNLGPIINSSAFDFSPNISSDGSTLYFTTDRDGANRFEVVDIWQAPILPIVDFNGDGNIDTDDLVILVNCWGTNESLCDIGPTPLGDGIVDMEDLKVFMSYWEQENMPAIPADE
ncbi:M56 family metallopeptidase [Planctomycetota bacterium]